MKAALALLVTLLLSFSTQIYADGCGGCDTSDWSDQYAYERTRSCDCECTDNGWRYNDCMSKAEYCRAFGNIGAR